MRLDIVQHPSVFTLHTVTGVRGKPILLEFDKDSFLLKIFLYIELNSFLKFSFRKPYIIGFAHALVIPDKCHKEYLALIMKKKSFTKHMTQGKRRKEHVVICNCSDVGKTHVEHS